MLFIQLFEMYIVTILRFSGPDKCGYLIIIGRYFLLSLYKIYVVIHDWNCLAEMVLVSVKTHGSKKK